MTYLLIGAAFAAAGVIWLAAAWRDIVKAQDRRRASLATQRARFSNMRPDDAEDGPGRRRSKHEFGRR